MKSIVLTSSSTRSAFFGDRSETTRDSCYFPGCRKDMNCNCEICQASINATLDLMPSGQQSSLTKLPASRLTPERTPISFDCQIPSTPESFACQNLTPALHSTAKSRPSVEKKRRSQVGGFYFWRYLVGVSLIYAVVDLGFQLVVPGLLGTVVSPQAVQRIGEESGMLGNLNERLGFVQRKLVEELIHGKVMNCSAVDSIWEVNQDGFLIHSRCVLYKSSAAEVSVWGWPLQTAGLLVTGFSSRSLTMLSGRVTELMIETRSSCPKCSKYQIFEHLGFSQISCYSDRWISTNYNQPSFSSLVVKWKDWILDSECKQFLDPWKMEHIRPSTRPQYVDS